MRISLPQKEQMITIKLVKNSSLQTGVDVNYPYSSPMPLHARYAR